MWTKAVDNATSEMSLYLRWHKKQPSCRGVKNRLVEDNMINNMSISKRAVLDLCVCVCVCVCVRIWLNEERGMYSPVFGLGAKLENMFTHRSEVDGACSNQTRSCVRVSLHACVSECAHIFCARTWASFRSSAGVCVSPVHVCWYATGESLYSGSCIIYDSQQIASPILCVKD